MRRPSETISFRLNTDVAKLVDRARGPFGISRGEWVRGLVVNHLQENPVEKLGGELVDLRQSVLQVHVDSRSLHTSIRRLAYLLLTESEPLTKEKAVEIVSDLFPKHEA